MELIAFVSESGFHDGLMGGRLANLMPGFDRTPPVSLTGKVTGKLSVVHSSVHEERWTEKDVPQTPRKGSPKIYPFLGGGPIRLLFHMPSTR